MGENPSDFLKGGRFNPRWLMECAMIEAIQEDRPMTFLGTTQAAFAKLGWEVRRFVDLVLKEFGLK